MDSSQLSQAAGISLGTTCESGYPAHLCPTCPCESGPLGKRIKWEHRQPWGRGRALAVPLPLRFFLAGTPAHEGGMCLQGLASHSQSLASSNNGICFENSLLVYSIAE